MFKRLLFLTFFFTSLSAELLQTEEAVQEINKATINTLLIFTSQEGLNSGLYHFSKTPEDMDMRIFHLPFIYHFKSDNAVNFFIVGNVGYSRVSLTSEVQTRTTNLLLNSLNHIQTYTAGIGTGIRYKIYPKFFISAGAEFIYSRAGVSIVKPEEDIGDVIEDFFNKNYSDNITYKFFTEIAYKPILRDFKPYCIFSYKLYETKSSFSIDNLADFRSESSVTTLQVGVESPKLLEYNKNNNLTLEAYLYGHYLDGVVKDVVRFNRYRSIGGVAYWNTFATPSWASRFFLELNQVQGDGLNGYNIGIGFTLDL